LDKIAYLLNFEKVLAIKAISGSKTFFNKITRLNQMLDE